MADKSNIRARVSMLVDVEPAKVFSAFVEPAWLTRFWLAAASGPLAVGQAVEWEFMVPGATGTVTATSLEPQRHLAWEWSDGTVRIDLEPFQRGTAVTLINEGFEGDSDQQVEAALNATEGFTIVLCDLKTLLEQGISANRATLAPVGCGSSLISSLPKRPRIQGRK